MFRIWVPDLDSPSYFVAIAAVELGFFKQEGIDIEFIYNTLEGPELMRDGKLDFIGGARLRGHPDVSRLERGQALVRPVAVFLLVHGRALDARCQTWRSPGHQRTPDFRRPGLAGNVAALHVGRRRYRPRTRPCSNCPSA